MRLLASGLGLVLLALAGCTPGTLGSFGMGGAGGTSATGGTTATGGTGGTGGTSATGATTGTEMTTGTGGMSSGTATLRITLPPTASFCDENPSCTTTQHLWIMNSAGQTLMLGGVGCMPECSTCTYPPCPELPVIACPAGNFGVAINSYDFTWDGSYVDSGSCAPSTGALAVNCVDPKFAAPGTYVARFCANPGTLSADGGPASCTATGPQECVEVGFTFPASQPVMITLPAG